MESLPELQARARSLETAGELAAALEIYQQLLNQPAGAAVGQHWVRAGDLQLRLGREREAADLYARAVERFVESGCSNVALALCQRLLRADPSRSAYLRRFGEIAAGLGYARDARHGAVEYAARMEQEGNPTAAVEALQAYLGRFSDDTAVRRRIEELSGGAADGTEAAAEPVAEGLDELQEPLEVEDDLGGDVEPLELLSASDDLDAGSAPDTSAWGVEESLVPTASEEPAIGDREVLPLEGLEPTASGGEWEEPESASSESLPLLDTGFEGADAAEQERLGESGEETDDLPLLGIQHDEPSVPETGAPEVGTRETAAPEAQATEAIEAEATEAEAPETEAIEAEAPEAEPIEAAAPDLAPLPEMELGPSAAAPADPVNKLRDRLARDPADTVAWASLAEVLEERGDREALVDALLGLARAQEAELHTIPARQSFARVLQIDPSNEAALRALASATPTARPPRDYIDLGELILSDDSEDDTRFQVDVAGPTGNEMADLEEILGLFREKVAQGIDPKDTASHYDLGVAFKEMGLYDDAIRQLQSALQGGAEPLPTLEILGECFVGKGEYGMAARVLERASRMAGATESGRVGILYWLGRSREALGEAADARSCFERVVAVDPTFRDVAARLESLESG